MSSFEFLSVLLSVVVGLGMANIFRGVGQLLHVRRSVRFSVVHLAWSVWVFFAMVIFWWTVVFGWKDWPDWNIVLFLFLLTYGLLLFLLSAMLYPSAIPASWDMFAHFVDMRRWFFGVYLCFVAAELTDTGLKDHFVDFALPYALLITSWVLTAAWAWISADRRTHTIIAVYHVVSLVAWIVYQLRDLEW